MQGRRILSCTQEMDPWALLNQLSWIMAPPDDEWALLGTLVGKQVLAPETGLPVPPTALLQRLYRRISQFSYHDPYGGQPVDALTWIGILADWRRQIDANRRLYAVAGIAGWKRRTIAQFLWAGRPARLMRHPNPERVPPGQAIGVWPSRAPRHLAQRAEAALVCLATIEDGFIRSLGLGAHLHPPRSIILDFTGAPFDPNRPSDLERLLNETEFSAGLRARAARLIDLLRRGGITKYSAGPAPAVRLPAAPRTVLVPGQVEDDLSVRLGGGAVEGNLDLLRRVRALEPGAYIVYKPHPDVVSGLRRGAVSPAEALRYADALLPAASTAALLEQVDAVHVLTSLAGFEALLRGRQVITHGQPFYAGWGLTQDCAPAIARRRRRLTLEELVAGALILYPRYLDPVTGLPCPPEVLIERHCAAPSPRPDLLVRLRRLQGQLSTGWRRMLRGAGA